MKHSLKPIRLYTLTTTRTYDELNRTTTKTVPHIGTSTYAYDIIEGIAQGHTKEITTDPKGNSVERVYDKTGRLSTVASADGLQHMNTTLMETVKAWHIQEESRKNIRTTRIISL